MNGLRRRLKSTGSKPTRRQPESKIEIVNVQPDANVEAVRRQLAQKRVSHVAVQLPEGWTQLDNIARLRLVQRQAQFQHCHLALITRHESTQRAARRLGIPVFARSDQLAARIWHMHPPVPLVDPKKPDAALPEPPPWRRQEIVERTARPSLHQARQKRIQIAARRKRPLPLWLQIVGYSAMAAVLLGVLLFFALYVLPAATITLVPGREQINVAVTLTADGNIDTPDLDANVLPARFVETTIEETGTIATTGSDQKPSDRAAGSVVFSNLSASPVEIPVGTVVNTSTGTPVSFRTTAPASLEGGVGARVTVPIEALEPGIEGNVRANTINTVSGALRFRVRVINPNGTGGGGSNLVAVVTQQDKDNLLAQVQERVEEQAYAALQNELLEGEWLPPESVQVFTIAQVFDKFNDDEGDEVNLTLRALVQGTALDQEQTNRAMLDALRTAVPERGLLVADSVRLQRAPGVQAVGRQVQFTMTANADYVIPIDPADVRQTIAGQSPTDAADAVASRWPLESPPDIYHDPAWLATLPSFTSRIQVRVEYADNLALPAE